MIGDSPALDFANTFYAVRGRVREGLASGVALAAWLAQIVPRLQAEELYTWQEIEATQSELDQFLELRTAIRQIAAALTAGSKLPGSSIDVLNQVAALAPLAGVLDLDENGTPEMRYRSYRKPFPSAMSGLAADAIRVFTGDRRGLLRACKGPGCYLFFVKDHPRREWCTPACGMRARAARAYSKKTQR